MLTQIDTLRDRLGITDTEDDELLAGLLAAVSAQIGQHCARTFGRTGGATFEVEADLPEFALDPFPVESITSVALKDDETAGWVAQTGVVWQLRGQSVIYFPGGPVGTSGQRLRVTFTGGYVLPGDTVGSGQTALPADIEQAAIEQVVHWYQNRRNLGVTSVSTANGSVSLPADQVLLPIVKSLLRPHRRLIL